MNDEGYELDEYSRLVIYKKYFCVEYFDPELIETIFPPDFKFYFFGCRTNVILDGNLSIIFNESLFPKNLTKSYHIPRAVESIMDIKYRMEKLNV